MAEMAAFLIEAASPVSVLIAQVIHAGKPFLHSRDALPALTHLLEDPTESQAFAAYLRGENSR
jgi:hypothetical protein